MTPSPRSSEGKKSEIKVRLPETIAAGVYANSMMVQHSGEEFVLDFAMVTGGTGTVVARIVASPAHAKRMVAALQDNIRKYEASHGPIKGSQTSPPLRVGFHPPAEVEG